jgi:hypothetical protein
VGTNGEKEMKAVTVFASRTLGSNPDESLQTAFTTNVVNPQENHIDFAISILLLSESDNDVADIKMYLKSPLGNKGTNSYQQNVIGEKKDQHIALGFYTRMPFASEGPGNYNYIVEINGSVVKEELLFELKYQDAPNPTTAAIQHA